MSAPAPKSTSSKDAGECMLSPDTWAENFSKHKTIFKWDDPFKTAAIVSIIFFGSMFKSSMPIIQAVCYMVLSLTVVSAIVKAISLKLDDVKTFHQVFLKMDREFFDKLYTAHALPVMIFIADQTVQVISLKNPIKSACVAIALYFATILITAKLICTIIILKLLFFFGVYPAALKFGVDLEPVIKTALGVFASSIKTVCSSVNKIANSEKKTD